MTTHNVSDWVSETTSTVGTGSLTLTGARTGYASFSDSFTNGQLLYYSLTDGYNRESGIGTYVSPSTLQRTTVIATINNGTLNKSSPNKLSLSGNAIVSCVVTAKSYDDKEDYWGAPSTDGQILTRDADGTSAWVDPAGISSVVGYVIEGSATVAVITAKTASQVGEAWIATDTGTDSNGKAVAVDDVLSAADTSAPSKWVNIGPVTKSEFADNSFNIYDSAITTKKIAFEATNITGGNTRTITMPDTDVDLADIATNTSGIAELVQQITGGYSIDFDMSVTVGTGTNDEPDELLYTNVNDSNIKLKAELTWGNGTPAGTDGNVTQAVYKYTTDNWTGTTTLGTKTITYNSDSTVASTAWS